MSKNILNATIIADAYKNQYRTYLIYLDDMQNQSISDDFHFSTDISNEA